MSAPADLQAATSAAEAQYGLPSGILLGIWAIESGSTYPNPAVNSSGYGGLFGTTLWNGSTQDQANYAASILAGLIKQCNGDVGCALSKYSGGGYSSVAGYGGGNWTAGPSSLPGGNTLLVGAGLLLAAVLLWDYA